MKVLWILLLPMAFWTKKAALVGKSTLLKINYGYLILANLERQYFAGVYSQLKMMSHSKHGRFNLHNTPFHQQLKEVDSSANRIALHKYNGTTLYEHPLTTDCLLCPWGPWGKKALTFL